MLLLLFYRSYFLQCTYELQLNTDTLTLRNKTFCIGNTQQQLFANFLQMEYFTYFVDRLIVHASLLHAILRMPTKSFIKHRHFRPQAKRKRKEKATYIEPDILLLSTKSSLHHHLTECTVEQFSKVSLSLSEFI